MKKINETLMEIRKKHKISRKGLESISGFKERTIASYERGERAPSEEYIKFLSIYFNIENINCNDNYFKHMTVAQVAIERCKYIYNLTSKDIMQKATVDGTMIELDGYDEDLEALLEKRGLLEDDVKFYISLCHEFKIKPSQLGFIFTHRKVIFNNYESSQHIIVFFTDELRECENIQVYNDISEEKYLDVLKKRNTPQEIYIPDEKNINNEIKEEYKEILYLLDYVPSKFIDDLLITLRKIKKEQDDFLKN